MWKGAVNVKNSNKIYTEYATHDNALHWCILDFVKLPLAHVVRTDPAQDRLAQHLKG